MALFVAFEGIDGSGKTAQIRILRDSLVARGYNPLVTQEPGGTPLGEAADRWLKKLPNLSPLTELLLFEAARVEHVGKVIQPALKAGRIVLCDRFTASSIAYQAWGRGMDAKLVEELNRLATGGLQPSLTFFLDLPWQKALSRRGAADADNFEKQGPEFYERVREGYLSLAAANPKGWAVIEGAQSREAIAEEIRGTPFPSSPFPLDGGRLGWG